MANMQLSAAVPGKRTITTGRGWPIGLASAALTVFVFYTFILPWLAPGVRAGINQWMPLNTINISLAWIILAVGLNIVVGYAGLLDLGFVAFWAIGGYTVGWLMSDFIHSWKVNILGNPWPGREDGVHLNFVPVIIAAACICAFFGLLIGAPTLRLKSDYLALVTLGFGEIIPQVFKNGENLFGTGINISDGVKGINGLDRVEGPVFTSRPAVGFSWESIGPFAETSKYVITVILAVLVIFMSLRLREGRLGRAWLAIREDELAASAMGVSLMKTKLAAYAVGAIAGGIGGAAYTANIGNIQVDTFDFGKSIILLAMVVLGGMGNVWGVTIGAFVVTWVNYTGLKEMGNAFNGAFGTHVDFTAHTFLIFGLTLVLMMLFRREGILPEARTRMVLHEAERTQAEAVGADLEQSELDLETPPEAVASSGGTTR
jgi:branched-chain amino acid transport system permease protein